MERKVIGILLAIWWIMWHICVAFTVGALGIYLYYSFALFVIEHSPEFADNVGFEIAKIIISITIIGAVFYFSGIWEAIKKPISKKE